MITAFQSILPAGRQRYLALGHHYADVIKQIRERGMDAALEVIATMGGVRQPKSIAQSLVKAAGQMDTVPAYRITEHFRRRSADGAQVVVRVVEIPHLTWEFRGNRQIGKIEWLPMFFATDRRRAPVIRRPLPV